MKFNLILFVLTIVMSVVKGQNNTITVTFNSGGAVGSKLVKTTTDAQALALDPAQAITVNVVNAPVGTTVSAMYNASALTVTNTSPNFVIANLSTAQIASYSTYIIIITAGAGESATYQNVAATSARAAVVPPPPVVGNANTFPATSASEELARLFTNVSVTDFGISITGSSINLYTYLGDKYSHIFLDQFGNSILGAIPQGISNRQYVVHIIYLTNRAKPSQISYSLKQTKGSFSSSLVFNNAGQLSTIETHGTNAPAPAINYVWAHQEFLLRTSTDNIEFEVSRNILNDQGLLTLESTIVAKHTIEMSKVFHGSFDVGLLSTHLANPEFQQLPSINNANQKVVKQSGDGNRGIVTAMATFYTSPIVLIEKYLFGMDIPNYKLTGRNFLDDHKIYERIFPALGVSITDKTFKNLFFGLNWELARGASVFAGIHYGEVNTFRTDNNFIFEETIISDAEFNLRSDKKWKTDFAFGANLDLTVVTNLFKQK